MEIVVLAPHTDDAELGCGATIARMVSSLEARVRIVNFSAAEESVPSGFARDVNRSDCKEAARLMGVTEVECLDFPVRRFPEFRQDILQLLFVMNKSLKPDLVFCPSRADHHQDHATVTAEAIRAFTSSTVLGYEVPWNSRAFSADVSISVEVRDGERKIAAVAAYSSQTGRRYTDPIAIRSALAFRGTQAGVDQAEAFEFIRGVW